MISKVPLGNYSRNMDLCICDYMHFTVQTLCCKVYSHVHDVNSKLKVFQIMKALWTICSGKHKLGIPTFYEKYAKESRR